MSRGGQSQVDGAKTLRVLLVHLKSTPKTERYTEVPPGREREVIRSLYVERDALKSIVDGAQFPPGILEVTLRAVDPEELR